MRTLRPAPRGQSTVELALALLIFVSVAIVGVHFAEVGYLPIKVHEAAVSPLWDSTALRVYKINVGTKTNIGDFTPFNLIPNEVSSNANTRYHDFDGRSATSGAGGTAVAQVFTRIRDMLVRCEPDTANAYVAFDLVRGDTPALSQSTKGSWPTIPAGAPTGAATDSVLSDVYQNMGGVMCNAEATLETLPSLPTNFLDNGPGGFFSTPQAKDFTMKVCSVGRPVGGTCKGRFGILLGDWSFSDPELVDHCPLQPELPDQPCSENEAFYYSAMSVFDHNKGSAGHDASKLTKHYTGKSPIDEDGFFMSYRGEEDGYEETLTPEGEANDMIDRPYNTGGVENKPSAVRRDSNTCFLGLSKC